MRTTIEMDATIDGDDVYVRVDGVVHIVRPWRGSAASAPSDADYYGYAEAEIDRVIALGSGREVPMSYADDCRAEGLLIEKAQEEADRA